MGDLHRQSEDLRTRLDKVKRRLRFDPYLDPEVGYEEQEARQIVVDRQTTGELLNIVGDTIDLVAQWAAPPMEPESSGSERTTIPLREKSKVTFRVVDNEVIEVEESSEDAGGSGDDDPYSPSTPSYQGPLVGIQPGVRSRSSLGSTERDPDSSLEAEGEETESDLE